MLVQIVTKYLESHKRLVIPQLGAFIVKEPGQVLFSELLKRDDGVLRSLLMQSGMNGLEAAGEIDRFVFEIRHAVERGVGAPLGGLGLMKPGPNGTITFDFNPQQKAPEPVARKRKAAEGSVGKDAAAEGSVGKDAASENSVGKDAASVNSWEKTGHNPRAADTADTTDTTDAADMAGNKPGQSSSAEELLGQSSQAASAHASPSGKGVFAGPNLSRSVKLNPEPYIKGLRYSKPHKNTNAYTYVGHNTRRWGVDRFLLVAILAAVIAVAAITFGYFRKSREEQAATVSTQQVQTDAVQAEQPTPKR